MVSIHAPAWGATEAARRGEMKTEKFQSTRPRGARRPPPTGRRQGEGFQSTRPRGARPELGCKFIGIEIVSIHAPAWGATAHRDTDRCGRECFNPRARVGRDRKNSKGDYYG